MAQKPAEVELSLEKLHDDFFVRVSLNQERVGYFADLYKSEVKLPPILVWQDDDRIVKIDGRHRIGALEILRRKTATCIFVQATSREEAIALAFAANFGGPLSPSNADIAHTIRLLLEAKLSGTKIVDMIRASTPGFPPTMLRRYVSEAQTSLARAKLARAVRAVAQGDVTVVEVAREHGVDENVLRKALHGKADQAAKDRTRLTSIKGGLSSKYFSLSRHIGAQFRALRNDLDDGTVDPIIIAKVLKAVEVHNKDLVRQHGEWVKRFAAKRGEE